MSNPARRSPLKNASSVSGGAAASARHRISMERVLRALPEAAKAGARVVCFPEAYVPGYPWGERRVANGWVMSPSATSPATATIRGPTPATWIRARPCWWGPGSNAGGRRVWV